MKYLPSGSAVDRVSARIELSETSVPKKSRPGAALSLLTPLDPLRQAKRLPIRVIKMLTAHTGHLLHPEYLQPLTPAPVSIEVFMDFFLNVFIFLAFLCREDCSYTADLWICRNTGLKSAMTTDKKNPAFAGS